MMLKISQASKDALVSDLRDKVKRARTYLKQKEDALAQCGCGVCAAYVKLAGSTYTHALHDLEEAEALECDN